MPKGKLMRKDERKLDANLPYLVKELDTRDITGLCLKKGLISNDDKEEIESLTRNDRRVEKLLSFVRKSGKEGFGKFLECLEPDYKHVAEQLRNTPVDENDPRDWFQTEHYKEIKVHPITEADATRISFCLGRGWEHLMSLLDISEAEIFHAKENHRISSTIISRLLIRWKQKKAREATIQVLINNLENLDDEMEIDWNKLKTAIEEMK